MTTAKNAILALLVCALPSIVAAQVTAVRAGRLVDPDSGMVLTDQVISGILGAAREAALHRLPAFAISLTSKSSAVHFDAAARLARSLAGLILRDGLPDEVQLNVNVPDPWEGEVRFTRQSKKIARNQLTEGKDPRRLFQQKFDKDFQPGTDYAAIAAGAVPVTPHPDPTHAESLNHLSRWAKLLEKTS